MIYLSGYTKISNHKMVVGICLTPLLSIAFHCVASVRPHHAVLRNFFEQEEVRAMFQSLDLSARDSWTLFELLDEAGNGDINLSVSGPRGRRYGRAMGKKLKSAPVSTTAASK